MEFITKGLGKAGLQRFFDSRTPAQLDGLQAIAMDMWEPYVQAPLEAVPLPREKIVFDRFHIMQHMTRAVDTVRQREHRGLLQYGDGRLKRTIYLWLSSEESVGDSRRPFFARMISCCHHPITNAVAEGRSSWPATPARGSAA